MFNFSKLFVHAVLHECSVLAATCAVIGKKSSVTSPAQPMPRVSLPDAASAEVPFSARRTWQYRSVQGHGLCNSSTSVQAGAEHHPHKHSWGSCLC